MDQSKIIESFHQGHCTEAYKLFGAHFTYEGAEGVRFTVYAPHARNVSIIGSFTGWEANPIGLERTGFEGVWSGFVAGVQEWEPYKYRIETRNGQIINKADPYAFYSETRPETATGISTAAMPAAPPAGSHVTWSSIMPSSSVPECDSVISH